VLLYVLFVGMCLGVVSVRAGFVWACVYGVGCWWGCSVSVLLVWGEWGVSL
jgi:hypothetical protein